MQAWPDNRAAINQYITETQQRVGQTEIASRQSPHPAGRADCLPQVEPRHKQHQHGTETEEGKGLAHFHSVKHHQPEQGARTQCHNCPPGFLTGSKPAQEMGPGRLFVSIDSGHFLQNLAGADKCQRNKYEQIIHIRKVRRGLRQMFPSPAQTRR